MEKVGLKAKGALWGLCGALKSQGKREQGTLAGPLVRGDVGGKQRWEFL